VPLDLVDGPFAGFVLHVIAGDAAEVASYRAALLLEGERVRGVDYSEIERKRFYRDHLVKG
jgi:hypothetical protein